MAKKEKENKVFISNFAFEELKKLFEKQKNEIRFLRQENKDLRKKAVKIYLQTQNPICNIIAE